MKHFLIFSLFLQFNYAQSELSTVEKIIHHKKNKNDTSNHLTMLILDELKSKIDRRNQTILYDQSQRRRDAQGLDRYVDIEHFRIHYTLNGNHAVNNDDYNNNFIPDYIDSLSQIIKETVSIFHKKYLYNLPPSDSFYDTNQNNGGSSHYDIYLRDISSNYYGFTFPELPAQNNGDNESSKNNIESFSYTTYLVLRNNYKDFPGNEINNLKVTFAHEYFHSIQFGYNAFEKRWLLEATAVWSEEQAYDHINDCYQFLPDWFKYPHRSLDESGTMREYGSYIFFEYITENIANPSIIQDIFIQSSQSKNNTIDLSHWVIDNALRNNQSSFKKALNGMSVANLILSSNDNIKGYYYPEAESYPVDSPTIFKTVDYEFNNPIQLSSNQLDRYGSQYIEVNTLSPIFIELFNKSGPDSDLQMNNIIEKNDGSYLILSSSSINIDPQGTKRIFLSIVSQDTVSSEWNYSIEFQNGKPGTRAEFPKEFILTNAYPNPFNNSLKFDINVLKPALVDIYITDILGRRIRNLFNGEIMPGTQLVSWDGRSQGFKKVASGIYYIVAKGNYTEQRIPVTLMK